MRTTIDLDPELHGEAVALARATSVSLSDVVNDALRRALHPAGPVRTDDETGLGVVRLGRPLTTAEVAVLDD